MLRIGIKVAHLLHALFTGSHLRTRMNHVGHLSANGLFREDFFRYLLDSEAKRSRCSGHHYQVLLVFCTDTNGALVQMEADLAQTVISAMSRSVRDTDYIGWYRDGMVVGGVLTLLGRDSTVDAGMRLRTTLTAILQAELGQEESHRVQVRVYQQHEVSTFELS